MNPAEATAAPRVQHQWTPDELRLKNGPVARHPGTAQAARPQHRGAVSNPKRNTAA